MRQDAKTNYGVLHNRKTGGTALKEIIDQQKQRTPGLNVSFYGHAMTFPLFVKNHPADKAVFFIRDPLSRFVSGFYSRLREGRPRYYHPWTKAEAKAFKRFQTPNQLAESLFASRIFERWAAMAAMKSIGHVRHTYLAFLGDLSFLNKNASRIAFIGHQIDFDMDLLQLRLLLKVDPDIQAPKDEIRAHRNPEGLDKHLTEKAIANLKKWYRADFEIYAWCLDKRKELLAKIDNLTLDTR